MIVTFILILFIQIITSLKRIPLTESYYAYFMNLYVGTPLVQVMHVKVDTGSPLTTIPCYGCRNCKGNSESFYDPDWSSGGR